MISRVPPPAAPLKLTDRARRMFEDLERQVNDEAARQRELTFRMRQATPIGTGTGAKQQERESNE